MRQEERRLALKKTREIKTAVQLSGTYSTAGLRDIAARLNETAREKSAGRKVQERSVDAPANRRPDAYSFDFLPAFPIPPLTRPPCLDSENSNLPTALGRVEDVKSSSTFRRDRRLDYRLSIVRLD